jgi:hypothetical protein
MVVDARSATRAGAEAAERLPFEVAVMGLGLAKLSHRARRLSLAERTRGGPVRFEKHMGVDRVGQETATLLDPSRRLLGPVGKDSAPLVAPPPGRVEHTPDGFEHVRMVRVAGHAESRGELTAADKSDIEAGIEDPVDAFDALRALDQPDQDQLAIRIAGMVGKVGTKCHVAGGTRDGACTSAPLGRIAKRLAGATDVVRALDEGITMPLYRSRVPAGSFSLR